MTVKLRDVDHDQYRDQRVAFTSWDASQYGADHHDDETMPQEGDVFVEWGAAPLYGLFVNREKFFRKIAKEFGVAIYEVGHVTDDGTDSDYDLVFIASDVGYHRA